MTGYRHGTYARALSTRSVGRAARSPGGRARHNHFVTVYYNEAPMRVRTRLAETGVTRMTAARE